MAPEVCDDCTPSDGRLNDNIIYCANMSVVISTVSHETTEIHPINFRLPLDTRQQADYYSRMVEIPDPLPRDVAALHKLIRDLAREITEDRRRIELMERLLERLERLVGKDERPVE